MRAWSYATQNAAPACPTHAERMHASHAHRAPHASQSMHDMCMGMGSMAATSATSTIIVGTGVLASVFLFVVHHLISSLLLATLVVLISLLLTGLTGLVSLESLVGHIAVRRDAHTTQGD